MKILKKRLLGVVALTLCLASVTFFGTACKKQEEKVEVKDPILECGEEKIPLCFYEFMLSRTKGDLARNKYDVKNASFWAKEYGNSGKTNEEYYNEQVLESCKRYLAAAVLFDRQGLKLTDAELAAIDEEIAYYIDLSYVGNGSVDKFNSIIKSYGVDSEGLKQCYIIEAKYNKLVSTLYGDGSLISDGVKEEFYMENYVRFKQVLFPKFYYEYEKDTNGDLMYFDPSKGITIYDTKNGRPAFDEKGDYIVDRFGVEIYYDADGNILYDKVNGTPAVVTDDDGNGIKHNYTADELKEKKGEAQSLVDSLKTGDFAAFNAAVSSNVLILGSSNPYPDGYYLSDAEGAGYVGDSAYLSDILAALKEMSVGEVRMIESDNGYHVIMKYELDSGKSTHEDYDEWFANLDNAIINKMLNEKLATVLAEIKTIDENLQKARSIKSVGTNYDY